MTYQNELRKWLTLPLYMFRVAVTLLGLLLLILVVMILLPFVGLVIFLEWDDKRLQWKVVFHDEDLAKYAILVVGWPFILATLFYGGLLVAVIIRDVVL